MQLLHGEYQVPVLAPHNVAVLDGESAKLAWVKVLVVLRMRVAADEITYVYRLHRAIVESQTDRQVARILGFGNTLCYGKTICPIIYPSVLE